MARLVYRSAPPDFIDGDPVDALADKKGRQIVVALNSDGTAISGGGGSSSGGAGGGAGTYSNAQGDFVATANNGTKTLTLSALANSNLNTLTALNFAGGVVKQITTAGVVTTLPLTTISWNNTTKVLTITDMTGNFATTDTVLVMLIGIDKAMDETNDLAKVSLGTSLDEDIDSISVYGESYDSVKVSASGIVSATPISLVGYYVEASAAGNISLYNNASAASGDTMLAKAKAVTTGDVIVLENPVKMSNGIYFSLVSGTATVFVFTRKTTAQ